MQGRLARRNCRSVAVGTARVWWWRLLCSATPHLIRSSVHLSDRKLKAGPVQLRPRLCACPPHPAALTLGNLAGRAGAGRGQRVSAPAPGHCQPHEDLCLRAGQRVDSTGPTLGHPCREPVRHMGRELVLVYRRGCRPRGGVTCAGPHTWALPKDHPSHPFSCSQSAFIS